MNQNESIQLQHELIAAWVMNYDRQLEDEQAAYIIGLLPQNLSYGEVSQAIRSHCLASAFPPKAADLISQINGNEDELKAKGAALWATLCQMIENGHADKDLWFEDWRANVAISQHWAVMVNASNQSYKALESVKYDVVRAYVQARRENAVTGFTRSPAGLSRREYLVNCQATGNKPKTIPRDSDGNLMPESIGIATEQFNAIESGQTVKQLESKQ